MKILGITGQSTSGKSTLAQRVVDTHQFVEISFADEIKRIVRRLTNCNPDLLWGASKLRSEFIPGWGNLTARIACKQIGDAGVECHEDMWIRKLEETVDAIFHEDDYPWNWYNPCTGVYTPTKRHTYRGCIIPDCRQIREMQWVRSRGGKRLRLKGRAGTDDTHRTEVEQLAMLDSEFDFVIDNSNMTVAELHASIDEIVYSL